MDQSISSVKRSLRISISQGIIKFLDFHHICEFVPENPKIPRKNPISRLSLASSSCPQLAPDCNLVRSLKQLLIVKSITAMIAISSWHHIAYTSFELIIPIFIKIIKIQISRDNWKISNNILALLMQPRRFPQIRGINRPYTALPSHQNHHCPPSPIRSHREQGSECFLKNMQKCLNQQFVMIFSFTSHNNCLPYKLTLLAKSHRHFCLAHCNLEQI